MKKHTVLLGLLCLNTLTISAAASAEGYSTDATSQTYYSSTPAAPTGYSVQPTTQTTTTTTHRHKPDEKLAISINLTDGIRIDSRERHHSRHREAIEWVTIDQGDRLPRDIVTGGYQTNPPATLYVCRGAYRGGAHPGKLFKGACNIGWGGQEVVIPSHYEVLTSRHALHWAPASYGVVPPRAIEGGFQHDGRLYICQARYRGGMHPGKLYKEACLIGWGGQEVAIPEYYVLTH